MEVAGRVMGDVFAYLTAVFLAAVASWFDAVGWPV